MNTTLEEIDRWQAAPLDVETLARIVHATSPAAGAVTTACTDVRRKRQGVVEPRCISRCRSRPSTTFPASTPT